MTHRERRVTPSDASCGLCGCPMSVQELEEFRMRADGTACPEAHCRICAEEHLRLCRECSARYAAGDAPLCAACAEL